MAFDGITVSSIVNELNEHLTGGRIAKIAQPESDASFFLGKRLSSSDLSYRGK